MSIHSVNIVFFSGTGGTRRVAEGLKADEVERKYGNLTELPSIDEMAKGRAWSGVREYIHETQALEINKQS